MEFRDGSQQISRFGFYVKNNGKNFSFKFNLGRPDDRYSLWKSNYANTQNKGWSESNGAPWNQAVPYYMDIGTPIYFTLVYNVNENKEILYVNR